MSSYLCVFSTGEVINEKDRCRKCEGHKVCKETKLLEVHVDKGMRHGQKITFSGEADQAPGVEPGDIVLVLQEKEHEVKKNKSYDGLSFFNKLYCNSYKKPDFCCHFLIQDFRREGNDLYIVQRIGLVEALCGFQMTVTHLDGRQLLIKYPPGKIIEPGNQECLKFFLSEQIIGSVLSQAAGTHDGFSY